jgi:glycosyltransferase involved in cell wall biosynthesis
MNIIINAVATGESGTLSVAISFIERVTSYFPEHNFFFLTTLCSEKLKLKERKNVKIVVLPHFYSKRYFRIFSDNIIFPRVVNKLNADIVLTFDNLALKTNIKQIHIVGNPFMSKRCNELFFLGLTDKFFICLRRLLFYYRIKFVDKFVFQTKTMANAFLKFDKMEYAVIPNFHEYKKQEKFDFIKEKGYKYLLFVSYFYPHKNFEIFLPLAKLVKDNNLKIRFLVTFQKNKGNKLYEKIRKNKLDDVVINIGNLTGGNIRYLYENVDAIFFPSFLESFSRIIADAIHYRLPIIVSDAEYSRELLGESAFYFEPKDPLDAYRAIKEFLESENGFIDEKYSFLEHNVINNEEIERQWKNLLEKEIKNLNKS